MNWARTEGSTIFLLLTTVFANQGSEIILKENQTNVNTNFSSIAEEITVAETSVEEVENNKGVSEKLEATRIPNPGRQDSSTPKGRLHRFTEHVNHIDEISAKIAENNEPTETHVSFSMRTKAEPKVKGIGYKVFYRGKDGKLYPPMVANPGGADTPAVYAPISDRLRGDVLRLTNGEVDLIEGSHSVSVSDLWHSYAKHCLDSFIEDKQLNLTHDDLRMIPDIVENYDSVKFVNSKKGYTLAYTKTYGDVVY